MKDLFIYEEIMLLALRDDEGTFSNDFVELAVAGAILAELLLEKKIFIADDKRKLVDHNDPSPMGDPIIDECLEKITQAKRRAALTNWIPRLARIPDLRQKVAHGLVERGIVRTDEEKVLFLFPKTVYPEINPEPEKAIIKRLKDAIFKSKTNLDPRTIILISLAHRTDLLKHNLGKKEVYQYRGRIKKIIEGEVTGEATGDFLGVGDSTASALSLIPALIAGSASS